METEDARPRLHLMKLDHAAKMLAECKTVDAAKDIKDKAVAIAHYLREKGASISVQNDARELYLRAERREGQLLATMPKQEGGRPPKTATEKEGVLRLATLADMGISFKESARAQKLAALPDQEFETRLVLAKEGAEKITVTSILGTSSASDHDGNEWMTPPEYIERAHSVLGKIDLDPASSARANEAVKAVKFFTKDDDGLAKKWKGNVWLNPPFSTPLIGQFVNLLIESVESQDVPSAILLTNNATETEWFQNALDFAGLCCLPNRRIGFIGADGKPITQNRQAQAFFFFNCDHEDVVRVFGDIGTIIAKIR